GSTASSGGWPPTPRRTTRPTSGAATAARCRRRASPGTRPGSGSSPATRASRCPRSARTPAATTSTPSSGSCAGRPRWGRRGCACRAARPGRRATARRSPAAAARFLDGIDPRAVGVIHDVGNMLREGYEFDPWSLEILGEHLAHVHVKNTQLVPAPDSSPPWTWEWAPLRTGAAPLRRLFDALAGVGYTGWVSLEDFSTAVPLRERLADDLAYVRQLTAQGAPVRVK